MYILQTWKKGRVVYRIADLSKIETDELSEFTKKPGKYVEILTHIRAYFGGSPIFYSAEKAKLACLTQSENEPIYLNFRDYIFPEEK